MKIVSVILARGGSKGIPKKNIIDINGKPLIWYTIQSSLKSDVHKTFVSTDNDEIADVALECGVNEIVRRPSEISTDTSPSEEALLHFAEKIKSDYVIFIQPTSPLLMAKDINKGINLLHKCQFDSVFSAYEEHWAGRWKRNPCDEYPGILLPDNYNLYKRPRRQELLYKTYVENGAFYISARNNILTSRNRLSGHIGICEMPQHRSFQVDTLDDVLLIKKLLK